MLRLGTRAMEAVNSAPAVRRPFTGEGLLEEVEVLVKILGWSLLPLPNHEHQRVLAGPVELDSRQVPTRVGAVLRSLLRLTQHQPQIHLSRITRIPQV